MPDFKIKALLSEGESVGCRAIGIILTVMERMAAWV